MLPLIQFAFLFAFPALVIFAGMRDATSFTIQNWISLAIVGAFFPAALLLGLSPAQIGISMAVGAGALVAGMGMFAAGWIGGGDAKLFAAAGLWLGWPAFATYLLVTGMAGGALAMGLLALRSMWVRPYVLNGPAWVGRLATPGENVPYGVAIAVGALAAFPACALMAAFPGLS